LADQANQPGAKSDQGLEDLESQLDELLAQIEQSATVAPPPATSATPAPAPSSVTPPAAAADASAESADDAESDAAVEADDDEVDLVGVDLARQIQELLDDAKNEMRATGGAAADDPGPKLMAIPTAPPPLKGEEAATSEPVRAEAPIPAAAAAAPTDAETSENLDGTFEAPDAVVGEPVTQASASAPAVPPAPRKPAPATDAAADLDQLKQVLDAPDAPETPEDELAGVSGTFEDPQQALSSAAAEAAAATPVAAPAAKAVEPPAAAPAPTAAAAPAQPEVVDIKQIDALIAQSADDAVAGDFETIDDVLKTQGGAGSAKPAAAAGHDEHADAAAPAGEDDADAIEGDFSTPEQLIGGATATDVAAELDADAKGSGKRATRSAAAAPAAAEPAQVQEQKAARAARRALLLAMFIARLRQTCAKLNGPMQRVSPETRNLVGLIGLLTLFNGSVVVIGKLLGKLF
jgi:hypothetical protein